MNRRVHTLRLSAPQEGLIRRGAFLVEDALRTASLPDAGRLLIIRSLSLGRIHPAHSPSSVALLIERRLADLDSLAVYAEDPAAAAAPAVYFHDEIDSYVRLALRLARHEPAAEWFWPLAIPGWTPPVPRHSVSGASGAPGATSPAAALRALLHRLSQVQGAPGVAALIAALRPLGALEPLLAALRPEDGPPLLALLPDGAAAAPGEAPALGSDAAAWFEIWGAADARSIWLAAMLLADQQPARLEAPFLPALARAAVARTLDRRAVPGTPAWDAARESLPAALPDGARWTRWAGLFLLIPVLTRLGVGAFLEAEPALLEAGFAACWLHQVARRCGAPPEDPVLAGLPLLLLPEDVTFVSPPAWATLLSGRPLVIARTRAGETVLLDGRVALALWRGEFPAVVRERFPARSVRRAAPLAESGGALLLASWEAAARRWLRHHAQIGLAELVRRPGRVRWSRTHLDITFDHRQAEVRLRRAGVDLDPGWVPWLGRVVAFHYAALRSDDER